MAMNLVSTVTVGSGGAASIQFTNIPQDGKDLLILISARSDAGSFSDDMEITLNSGGTYSSRYLLGNGSSASSGTLTSFAGVFPAATATSNTFSNNQIYISNYTSSSSKTFSIDATSENNATSAHLTISAHRWTGTSAITSITLDGLYVATNLVQNSTFSLYIIS